MRRAAAGAAAAALLLALAASAALAATVPCDMRYPSDARVSWRCRTIAAGESVERLFGERWMDVLRFNRLDRRHVSAEVALKVPVDLEGIRDFTPMPLDYPDAAGEAKFLLVDLGEQFLGAYERGRLVFSSPLATGDAGHPTPVGEFRITAADATHHSSLYTIEGTDTPYPMTWALRFHVGPDGAAFWLHGRDVPGYPASHGCIGLYDERMQKAYYGTPARPRLEDARRLYEWVVGDASERGERPIAGPRVRIIHGASGDRSTGC
ncbi:MAG TPA: L,D-transpeptidase [Methylomirabilota bacterium]|nr:L,D-transpeptidase [Methylomirabilota bacterium]